MNGIKANVRILLIMIVFFTAIFIPSISEASLQLLQSRNTVAVEYATQVQVVGGVAPYHFRILEGGPVEFRQESTHVYAIFTHNAAIGTVRYEVVDANNQRGTGSLQIVPALLEYGPPNSQLQIGQGVTLGFWGYTPNAYVECVDSNTGRPSTAFSIVQNDVKTWKLTAKEQGKAHITVVTGRGRSNTITLEVLAPRLTAILSPQNMDAGIDGHLTISGGTLKQNENYSVTVDNPNVTVSFNKWVNKTSEWIIHTLRSGSYSLTIRDSGGNTLAKSFQIKGMNLQIGNKTPRSPLQNDSPLTAENKTSLTITGGTAPFTIKTISYNPLYGRPAMEQPLTVQAQGANQFIFMPKSNTFGPVLLRVMDANGAYEDIQLDIQTPPIEVKLINSDTTIKTGGQKVELRVTGGWDPHHYRVTTSNESILKFKELAPGYFVANTTMLAGDITVTATDGWGKDHIPLKVLKQPIDINTNRINVHLP